MIHVQVRQSQTNGSVTEHSMNLGLFEAMGKGLLEMVERGQAFVRGYSLPDQLLVEMCGNAVAFSGPEEEMRRLFKVTVLQMLFFVPFDKWRHRDTGLHLYADICEGLNVKHWIVTPDMIQYVYKYGYKRIKGRPIVSYQLPAKFAMMIESGIVTMNGGLISGSNLSIQNLTMILELWDENKLIPFTAMCESMSNPVSA